jgi:proteasome lid subunit RPN8/RPN11
VSENSRLQIPTVVLELLKEEALEAYPEECCGVLVGRMGAQGPSFGRVHEVAVAQNRATDRRQERYVIDPELLLRVLKGARERDLEVVGYYHSHPDHGANPGQFDLEAAWPDVCYVILAVDGERVTEVRCWRLRRDGGAFEEVDFGYSRCTVDPPSGTVKR